VCVGIDELCNVDSGYVTMLVADDLPHGVYVSVTRDGSVWLRAGRDHTTLDWIYVDEPRIHFQTTILAAAEMRVLQVLRYTQ